VPAAVYVRDRQPVLICTGGCPRTGKTTIARKLTAELHAAYVRVNTIETAVCRAEGRYAETNGWELPPGYLVGHEVAADQLRNGLGVVGASVIPLHVSRDAWRDAGLNAGARVVEVEVICSDATEHRRRAEDRLLDIPGLAKPTWEEISNREYHSRKWNRIIVDTATLNIDESVQLVRETARS
jgi:predicted kinase